MGTSISQILQVVTSAVGVAPGPATALVASSVGTTSLTLSWAAPTTGSAPLSYMPQFRLSGTTLWTNAIASPQAGLSAPITGLSPGAQYEFQVVVSSPFPPSSASATISKITLNIAPSAPAQSAATAVTSTGATLHWTAPATGTGNISYIVLARTPSGSGSFAQITTSATTSAVVAGLVSASSYDFEIEATNDAGTSPPSNVVSATTLSGVTAPGAPGNLSLSSSTSSSLTIAWTASAGIAGGTYTVQYQVVGQTTVATVAGISGLSTTVSGLQPSTQYNITVVGVNTAGPGAASNVLTTSTPGVATRSPFLQPGGNAGSSPWNTGIGTGAVLSGASDPDTLSLISKIGTVNGSNFGKTIVVGNASHPVSTFTSTSGAGSQRDANLTVSLHCPAGTTPTGPVGGDNDISVFDTTISPPTVYTFGPCTLTNGVDTQGGVTAVFGEKNLICGTCADALTGNFGYDSSLGAIQTWELDPVQNPSGRIRHVLRFALDVSQLLPPSAWDQPTAPDGSVQIYWPQTHTDFNGPTAYFGKVPAGALVCIPFSDIEPAGLSAGGHMLYDALKFQGAMWRDQSGGGVTFYVDKVADQHPMILGMRGDMQTICSRLRIVRNVGPTAIGGGGTIRDTNPAPPVDPNLCGSITAPGAPTGLASSNVTSSSIDVSWATGSGSTPQTFTLQVSPTGAGTWTTVGSGIPSNVATASGLSATTGYDFRVQATNPGGTSLFSTSLVNVVTKSAIVTTFDPATSTMTLSDGNLTATSVGAVMETAASTTTITAGGGLRQFEVTMATGSTDVGFGIINQAYSFGQTAGIGGDVNGVGFYPTIGGNIYCGSPAPLVNGAASSASGDVATIVFDPGNGTSTPQIWCSTGAMRTAGFAWNWSTTANPATGAGGVSLPLLVTGTYRVAVNDNIGGAVSVLNTGNTAFTVPLVTNASPWDANAAPGPATAPGTMGALTVGIVTATTVALSWSAPTGTPSFTYTVQSAPAVGGPFTTVASIFSATSATVGSLAPQTNVFFRVQATNSAGTGGFSPVTSALTLATPTTAPGLLSSGPLSTLGNQIVDAAGNPQRMSGGGWAFGYNRPNQLLGMDSASYQQFLDTVKAVGFNTLRLHTSDRAVLNGDPLGSFSTTLNPGFVGKTYLQCLGLIMDYGNQIGLRFIVDSHSNEGNIAQQSNGLWYDVGGASAGNDGNGQTGTITDAQWIQAWQTRASAFVGKPALIGYDLRNEPLGYGGMSTWGNMAGATPGSNTDIKDAYQRAGNAIHAIDPAKPLIICEGPQNYTGSYSGAAGVVCPQGDLTGVATQPVTLTTSNKVVYSIHNYPASVSNFTPDSGSGAISQWMGSWGSVFQNNLAPILIGEGGSTLLTASDQAWASTLVSFCNGTAAGGITLSGNKQGISVLWWNMSQQSDPSQGSQFSMLTSLVNGSLRASNGSFLSALQFKTTPGGGGTTGVSPPVVTPLGSATPGTWTLKSIGGMFYWELLPQGYSTAASYPLMLCLHQLDQGNSFYSNGNNPAADIVKPQWDPWVNNATFRKAHPCIVLLPLLNGLADTSGNTLNWGGIDNNQQPSQTLYISLVQSYMQTFSVNPNKVYITGNSMGGDGAWDVIIKYNSKHPLVSPIFASAAILAGVTFSYNYPTPTATMIANMKTVPLFVIHGGNNDTNSPIAWDDAMAAVIGTQVGGNMHYTRDNTLSHDVWDTYYVEPTAETFVWGPLFATNF